MAQGEQKEVEGGEQKASGKSKLVLIIGGVVALLALGGGVAYFLGAFGDGGAAEAAKHEPGHADEGASDHGAGGEGGQRSGGEPGSLVSLDTFVVNLADEKAHRYLKVTMQVEFFTDDPPERFSSRRAQIRDLLLTLLSSKTVDSIRTIEGKQQLRDEVIARIGRVVGDDVVKAVYFAEFIVQ